ALGFEDVSKDALKRADQGEVVIVTEDQDERVRALVRLDEFSGLYLYVGRFIEARVLAHRNETKAAADDYERLEGQRSGFQITFAFVFILVAMLFLVSAVAGRRLTAPGHVASTSPPPPPPPPGRCPPAFLP